MFAHDCIRYLIISMLPPVSMCNFFLSGLIQHGPDLWSGYLGQWRDTREVQWLLSLLYQKHRSSTVYMQRLGYSGPVHSPQLLAWAPAKTGSTDQLLHEWMSPLLLLDWSEVSKNGTATEELGKRKLVKVSVYIAVCVGCVTNLTARLFFGLRTNCIRKNEKMGN